MFPILLCLLSGDTRPPKSNLHRPVPHKTARPASKDSGRNPISPPSHSKKKERPSSDETPQRGLSPTLRDLKPFAPRVPVTNRKPNPNGDVYVAEYHHITAGKGPMFRTPAEFRSDLEALYKRGFRPVTLRSYLRNEMALPKGALPVVMTFDDAHPSQFRMLRNGRIDPNCMIGIWNKFAETHPDFPVRATFFVLPDLFYQRKWERAKVKWLQRQGCELANHTLRHVALRKQTDARVVEELAKGEEFLESLGVAGPHTVAYPFGSTPKNFRLMKGVVWKGRKFEFLGAVLGGANPAPSPNSPKLDPLRIPRIQSYNGPYNLTYWLKELDRKKVKPYVSAGASDPDDKESAAKPTSKAIKERGSVGLPGPRGGGQSLGTLKDAPKPRKASRTS